MALPGSGCDPSSQTTLRYVMHGVNIPLLREDADQLHWMQDWHQMKYVSRQAVNEHTQHQRGHCIIYHHKSHLSLEFPQFSYLYL